MSFFLLLDQGNLEEYLVAHVDEATTSDKEQFDMVIGTDLMEELGIDISFRKKTIEWDSIEIPMKKEVNSTSHRGRKGTPHHSAGTISRYV